VDLYSALDDSISSSRRSDMDHTVRRITANNTMPDFILRSHSPDGAATDCGDNVKLQLTTHLSTPKG